MVLPSFTLSSVVIYAVLVAATGVCYCAPTSLESDIESACAGQFIRRFVTVFAVNRRGMPFLVSTFSGQSAKTSRVLLQNVVLVT